MRAIVVCVDFADILAITLPRNLHWFSQVVVVTSPKDEQTLHLLDHHIRRYDQKVRLYVTDSFYDDGAVFNKWKALEHGLDFMGRDGWLCLMDADVLWPENVPQQFYQQLRIGRLYTPQRRILSNPASILWQDKAHLPEYKGLASSRSPTWANLVVQSTPKQEREFAGYTQIFHAHDPVLGRGPWHELDWRHAGGADSFFQDRWATHNKVRPPFEVIHLGEPGENWCGRTSPYLDGTKHPDAEARRQQLATFISGRVSGPHRFDLEKL